MPTVENIDLRRFRDRDPDPAKNPVRIRKHKAPAYNDEIEDLLVLGSAALLSKFRGNVHLLTTHHHLRERDHKSNLIFSIYHVMNLTGNISALKLI
jgi:hypothetical protein